MKCLNKYFLFVFPVLHLNCYLQAQQTHKIKYKMEYQQADTDRIKRTSGDSIFNIHVLPHDEVFNGNRAEILIKFKNENDHTYVYDWSFKISGKYVQSDSIKNHFIIAQWWNGPAKGQAMSEIKGKQGPPFHFTVVKKKEALYLQVYYGLQGKNKKKQTEFKIETGKWYHVKSTVYWSINDDGFADIHINDSTYHFTGANKYNDAGTDFKLGLYRNIDNNDTTEISLKHIAVYEKN